ncbi:MAG: molybdopterin oxidoreductase family protein, partial [Acidimicrobiia bacterium]
DGNVVVILGRPNLAEPAAPTVAVAAALAGLPGVRFLSALRRGNVHGALDLGLAPGLLPGRVALDGGRAWFETAWGGVPAEVGLDTAGILRAAAEGRIGALVLLGADPLSDFPDSDLARRALEKVPFIVAVDAFPTSSTELAHVVLPVAIFGEKRGTHTNLEGRILRLARKVTPPGTVMEDWRIAVELALRFDADFDLEAVDEVTDELARLAPAHRGVDAAALRQAVDGVVIPLGAREQMVVGVPGHAVSPVADADPGLVGGPIESLVTEGGPTAAFGVAADAVPVSPAPVRASGAASPGGGSPPLLRWDGSGAPADVANGGEAGLALVTSRRLYDAGVTVSRSAALAPLAEPGVVRVHPTEADRLGLTRGDPVRVSGPRASIILPMRPDPGVPPGVAWVPFHPPGPGGVDLVDGATLTRVRLESEFDG